MNIKDAHKQREIIDELFDEINQNKTLIQGETHTIFFRDDMKLRNKRQVFKIPIIYLKYRKDNGRISSDVYAYEQNYGEIIEETDTGQETLRGFLLHKDKERTEELKSTIIERLQDEPAVITCDGFLINGNRRKMVFELLAEEHPSDARYKTMEVVILPGKKEKPEDEPPPTYYEIEQIESAYQFHTQGKSEYTNFDKALSIRRKIKNGMTIEEQLSYDAAFNRLSKKEKEKKKKQIEEDFLNPLECIDQYLDRLGRNGLYNTIATAKGSKKGQWQAFIDYYKYVHKNLNDPKRFAKLGLENRDKGIVQDIAFKIIRARNIDGVDKKSHEIMRQIPKLLTNELAKNELFQLKDIRLRSYGETTEDEKDAEKKDFQWYTLNASEIIYRIRKAYAYYNGAKESETPLDLLKAAYGKLSHDDMKTNEIEDNRLQEALKLAEDVKDIADSLKQEIWNRIKNKK